MRKSTGKRIPKSKSTASTSVSARQKRFKYYLFGCLFLVVAVLIFFASNTEFQTEKYDLYISSERSDYPGEVLQEKDVVFSALSFKIASMVLNLKAVNPGLYEISKDWNNYQIITALKQKPDTAVSVVVKPYLIRKNVLFEVCKNLDIKHTALEQAISDIVKEKGDEFDQESIYSIFIPDTLYMYKNARAREVAERLLRNYKLFWNKQRLKKADSLGLSPVEVSILSSIIYAETKIADEMPRIAGLYLNRLRKGMRLQADPTLVYATGNYTLKRVWNKHKYVKSAYNTYRHEGLPPGPVMTTPTEAIDAVLNYEKHDYLYFSARNDFSGYHDFSKTYEEHLIASSKYQKELNKRKIF